MEMEVCVGDAITEDGHMHHDFIKRSVIASLVQG